MFRCLSHGSLSFLVCFVSETRIALAPIPVAPSVPCNIVVTKEAKTSFKRWNKTVPPKCTEPYAPILLRSSTAIKATHEEFENISDTGIMTIYSQFTFISDIIMSLPNITFDFVFLIHCHKERAHKMPISFVKHFKFSCNVHFLWCVRKAIGVVCLKSPSYIRTILTTPRHTTPKIKL